MLIIYLCLLEGYSHFISMPQRHLLLSIGMQHVSCLVQIATYLWRETPLQSLQFEYLFFILFQHLVRIFLQSFTCQYILLPQSLNQIYQPDFQILQEFSFEQEGKHDKRVLMCLLVLHSLTQTLADSSTDFLYLQDFIVYLKLYRKKRNIIMVPQYKFIVIFVQKCLF